MRIFSPTYVQICLAPLLQPEMNQRARVLSADAEQVVESSESQRVLDPRSS